MGLQASDILTFIGLVVQIVLAVVAIWYAIETRRLRLSSETQIVLLKEQGRSSLQPYIFPSITLIDKENARKTVEKDTTKSDAERAEALLEIEQDDTNLLVSLLNATTRIARDVDAWIYDSRTKNFLESDQSVSIMVEKDESVLPFSASFMSVEDVRSKIIYLYGDSALGIAKSIDFNQLSYVLVIYKDIEKQVYSSKRHFIVRDNQIIHRSERT